MKGPWTITETACCDSMEKNARSGASFTVSLLPHRQRKRSREEGEVCNCSLRKCNSTFSYLKHFCTDTKSLSMTCYKFLVFCFIQDMLKYKKTGVESRTSLL
ncbi:unnamed protein product [Lepidochelys kempii]